MQLSTEQHQQLLWLTWLSLSSVEELARIQHKNTKTIWRLLHQLETGNFISHVVLSEAHRIFRYYLTDQGLQYLAQSLQLPSPLPLAQSYPVTRADLQARLARIDIHAILSTCISHLLATSPAGSQLVWYQQPWKEPFRSSRGQQRFVVYDALYIVRTPSRAHLHYAISVDLPDRPFHSREDRSFLTHIQRSQSTPQPGRPRPVFLLLSIPARYSFWADLIAPLPFLQGAIGNLLQLEQINEQIWLPLKHLAHWPRNTTQLHHLHSLFSPLPPSSASLPNTSISPISIHSSDQAPCISRSLPVYVGADLQHEAQQFASQSPLKQAHLMLEALRGGEKTQIEIAAMLSLLLNQQQKTILSWLTRHPYLGDDDLLTLLHPGKTDLRLLHRHLEPLIALQLVQCSFWEDAPTQRERNRYHVTEIALRYQAIRHQRSITSYLHPAPSGSWQQRGIKLLHNQHSHTCELYRCIRAIYALASPTTYRIMYWKNAQEAVRWHQDALSHKIVFIRPDAELIYQLPGNTLPQSLLIEYDRGTTFFREHIAKIEAYGDYQQTTGKHLPPLLFILHRSHKRKSIQEAIKEAEARELHISLHSEEEVHRYGLQPLLADLLNTRFP